MSNRKRSYSDAFGHDGARPPVSKRVKYDWGSHGRRRPEQTHLRKNFGQKVSGDTHESEHPMQASLFAHAAQKTRGQVEKPLPAYQEVKEWHRGHAGTGVGTKTHQTGFQSAEQYRQHQKETLKSDQVSNAVQLQQLGMAFSRQASGLSFSSYNQTRVSQSNDSFRAMLNGMGSDGRVEYGQSQVAVSQDDLAEMLLARKAAITGQWPSKQDFENAREMANKNTFKRKG